MTLQNTILAGNSGAAGSADCSGTLTSGGYNLLGTGNTSCTISSGTGDVPTSNPLLGALTSHGSYTMYREPSGGSPAIDAGNNVTGCNDGQGRLLTVDQRNSVHPQNGRCDIGSVEVGNAPGRFLYLPLLSR